MTTTQLFVELLVIGFGVLIWVVLLTFGIFQQDLLVIKDIPATAIIPIIGITYVFGIILDRISRGIFDNLKKTIKENFLKEILKKTNKELEANQLERTVWEYSEIFNNRIKYIRSRLRIARAWTINFALICFSFIVWHVNLSSLPTLYAIYIGVFFFIFSLLSLHVSKRLQEDHYNEVRDSYIFISNLKDE